jgi:hypothetical protein
VVGGSGVVNTANAGVEAIDLEPPLTAINVTLYGVFDKRLLIEYPRGPPVLPEPTFER